MVLARCNRSSGGGRRRIGRGTSGLRPCKHVLEEGARGRQERAERTPRQEVGTPMRAALHRRVRVREVVVQAPLPLKHCLVLGQG